MVHHVAESNVNNLSNNMTAHIADVLLNGHPRVHLNGLHVYGVICGDVHANFGWGEERYRFADPGCARLWEGRVATYRLHVDGRLELVSYRLPETGVEQPVHEMLAGDFWLVLKPHFRGGRTYVPFKDGDIVEDEAAWVFHEPRLGKINANERVADAATRFLFAQIAGRLVEEVISIPAGSFWLVCLRHRAVNDAGADLRESFVFVDESTRQTSWIAMSAADWEASKDPGRMMLAVYPIQNAKLFWRLACALARRFAEDPWHEDYLQEAIRTTERWLDGQATEDDLNNAWFCTLGSGAGPESGWSIALELINAYAESAADDVAHLLRSELGNPFQANHGRP